MANLWSTLFGRKSANEERLSLDDWASYFKFNGQNYPIQFGSNAYSNKEEIGNDFGSFSARGFKGNGIVFACISMRMSIFSEARLQWQQIRQGRPQDLFGNKDLEIFERPWPNATTGDLLTRAIQDTDLGGNFYVVREGKRLRRLRPDWVEIVLTAPPAEAVQSDVAGYIYKPGGTEDREKWKIYPVTGENGKVAHWAPIPDPEAQYRGMSWLTPVVREIEADGAATRHKAAFFENAATPNIAVSFKETVTSEQFREFIDALDDAHTGVDNAYKTLYLGGGADVTPLTMNFQQLDLKNTQGHGETRIAVAARIPPVILGLSEGLKGSSLNAGNFQSARDSFTDGAMRPLWRSFCNSMEVLVRVPDNARLWYDGRDIDFLRRDIKELADIQSEEAGTITKLIQDGYTPDSIVLAVQKRDWSLLKHTGLFSVQLQPPMPDGPPDPNAAPAKGDGSLIKAPHSKPGRPSNAQLQQGPGGSGQKQPAPAAKTPAPPKKPTP